jgi:uncharacterized OB-fold protein
MTPQRRERAMSRQAEVEKVLREELWTHPDSAIEGFARAAARIDALYTAPADGCPKCGTQLDSTRRYCPGCGIDMKMSTFPDTPKGGGTA